MKRFLPLLVTIVSVLTLSACSFAAGAKLLYSEDFEGNLSKWGLGIDREPLTGQEARIFKGLAKSGNSSLELKCLEGVDNGTSLFLPFFDNMNLSSAYAEVWFYDKTGDRSAFVDQAYFVVGGPGGEEANAGWVQIGQNGNPASTEDQTRYSVMLAGPGWITDGPNRSAGWHKLGMELIDGSVTIYIDDKVAAETSMDSFEKLGVVGFLSYFSAPRDGAIGTALHESYWDDLKVYDKKP